MALSRQEFYDQIWKPKTSFVQYAPNWKNVNPVIAPSYDQFENDQVQVSSNGIQITGTITPSKAGAMKRDFDNAYNDYKDSAKNDEQTKSLAEIQGLENTRNTLAQQIAALAGTGQPNQTLAQPNMAQSPAVMALGSSGNFGASDLANKLNYQVSDDQILNDYNTSKLGSLNSVVDRGNAQIAGIQERLNAAQTLLNQLPSGDARRESSQVYVNQLKSDLTSVQSAVTDATNQIKDLCTTLFNHCMNGFLNFLLSFLHIKSLQIKLLHRFPLRGIKLLENRRGFHSLN